MKDKGLHASLPCLSHFFYILEQQDFVFPLNFGNFTKWQGKCLRTFAMIFNYDPSHLGTYLGKLSP